MQKSLDKKIGNNVCIFICELPYFGGREGDPFIIRLNLKNAPIYNRFTDALTNCLCLSTY